MANLKKYVLTIEYEDGNDECGSVTEELIYDDISLLVGELDMADFFDEKALELCKDCHEIGVS